MSVGSDACADATVTLPEAQTIVYTIGDAAKTVDLSSEFSIDPVSCKDEIEFTEVTTLPISSPFSWNASTKVLEIAQSSGSLDLMDGET